MRDTPSHRRRIDDVRQDNFAWHVYRNVGRDNHLCLHYVEKHSQMIPDFITADWRDFASCHVRSPAYMVGGFFVTRKSTWVRNE